MTRSEAQALLPRYFRGELSGEQRRDFVRLVLSDQRLYNDFAEQQLLTELLQDLPTRRELITAVSAVPRRWKIQEYIRAHIWTFRLALAFAVTALILIAVLIGYRAGRQPVPTAPLYRSAETASAPAVANTGPQDDHSQPDQSGAPAPGTLARPPRAESEAVLRFPLLPMQRGDGASNRLVIPKDVHAVLFVSAVDARISDPYTAILESADGMHIKTFDGIRPQSGKAGSRQVMLKVASDLLRPGNYLITLYTADDTSRSHPVKGYSFSVIAGAH